MQNTMNSSRMLYIKDHSHMLACFSSQFTLLYRASMISAMLNTKYQLLHV